MTATHTEYQRTRLESMAKSFGLDVSEAQHLSGQALDQWLDAAEDELFAAGLQDLREMKQERERGYRLPPA
jgi:hypothetical protein